MPAARGQQGAAPSLDATYAKRFSLCRARDVEFRHMRHNCIEAILKISAIIDFGRRNERALFMHDDLMGLSACVPRKDHFITSPPSSLPAVTGYYFIAGRTAA